MMGDNNDNAARLFFQIAHQSPLAVPGVPTNESRYGPTNERARRSRMDSISSRIPSRSGEPADSKLFRKAKRGKL